MTLAKAIRLEASEGGRGRKIVMRLHASEPKSRSESGAEGGGEKGSALSSLQGHVESDPHSSKVATLSDSSTHPSIVIRLATPLKKVAATFSVDMSPSGVDFDFS